MASPPTLTTRDIPQANSASRLLELLQYLATGESQHITTEFSHQRDRLFYLSAGRALGLIEQDSRLSKVGRWLSGLRGDEAVRGFGQALADSKLGKAWLRWQGARKVLELDPSRTEDFLAACSALSRATRKRRASTLNRWLAFVRGDAEQAATGSTGTKVLRRLRSSRQRARDRRPVQLNLDGVTEWTRWPSPTRFPHNEGTSRVGNILQADLGAGSGVLLVVGYASLAQVIHFLAQCKNDGPEPIRLLFGTEPFLSDAARARIPAPDLGEEMRDFWMTRGVSVLLSGAVLHTRELVERGRVQVRIAPPNRPIHAKIYLSSQAVTVGSSNFTPQGLGRQSEANVRFELTEEERYSEARNLAEGLWRRGREYGNDLIGLLETLLRDVTWIEALARACAAILEGHWAREYIPPDLLEGLERPLWPHQLQGISQAMWILENVGSVLVADATGSGKTRMGSWLIRAAFDRQYRSGVSRGPAPVILAPPPIVGIWEEGLSETRIPIQVHSHGPLSVKTAARHETLVRGILDTELLSVDEAHNYLNRSSRTSRLVAHYAENAILFTATPINRRAADLLALVELLGADNFSEESLKSLSALRRSAHLRSADNERLDEVRQEIRRFTVRRTRAQLNDIVDAARDKYRLSGHDRVARYPKHEAHYYDCFCRRGDLELAREIASLAEKLKGVSRLPKRLAVPKGLELSEEGYIRSIVANGKALARYHVMESLRSSRLALLEHVHGTQEALRVLGEGLHISAKKPTGNMASTTRKCAGQVPQWELDALKPPTVEPWLWDPEAHRLACEEDAETYDQIASRVARMSDDRERAKLNHIEQLLKEEKILIAFDSYVITLELFEHKLKARKLPVELLLGRGGAGAKRRAVRRLGLKSKTRRLVALCSDAFSEGMNLQRASCVIHLDTPTVIRIAEQRAGRIDRMDSPHERVRIWWPKDPEPFAPQRRDILRDRNELVHDLIGSNLQLPPDPALVDVTELAAKASVDAPEHNEHPADLYDAFRPVRALVGDAGLVPSADYESVRGSQAEVIACVSMVQSAVPWAFIAVGGLHRQAPRWVFFETLEGEPKTDLAQVADALQKRLGPDCPRADPTPRSQTLVSSFTERLRDCEAGLLPARRRRALELLKESLEAWMREAKRVGSRDLLEDYEAIRNALFPSKEKQKEPFPDPRSISDAWLRLIRPRVRAALERRSRRKRLWQLTELSPYLTDDPIDPEQLRRAFAEIPLLAPVEERVVAMIVGVPSEAS
ncbi:helicase-related protein [Hyalangium sp.]|uniref:helicase-related protein n=1 Tax=Hyalangium sp. TaxID=2028555 RepID=UPI002D511CF0|nr:helicase-related protein [Hyalangium sp.]HYI01145.1 helicase-related protein [Hyalangium sp.]